MIYRFSADSLFGQLGSRRQRVEENANVEETTVFNLEISIIYRISTDCSINQAGGHRLRLDQTLTSKNGFREKENSIFRITAEWPIRRPQTPSWPNHIRRKNNGFQDQVIVFAGLLPIVHLVN